MSVDSISKMGVWGESFKNPATHFLLKLDAISLARSGAVCRAWRYYLNVEFLPLILKEVNFFYLGEDYFKNNPIKVFVKIFWKISKDFTNVESPLKKMIWLHRANEGKQEIELEWKKINRIISEHQIDNFYFFIPSVDSAKEVIPLIERALLLGKWSYLNKTTHLAKKDRRVFHFVCQLSRHSSHFLALFGLLKFFVPHTDPIWKNKMVLYEIKKMNDASIN